MSLDSDLKISSLLTETGKEYTWRKVQPYGDSCRGEDGHYAKVTFVQSPDRERLEKEWSELSRRWPKSWVWIWTNETYNSVCYGTTWWIIRFQHEAPTENPSVSLETPSSGVEE